LLGQPLWYLRSTIAESLAEAFCQFDSDENIIVVLTDGSYLKISKRNPDTGALMLTSKRIAQWGDTYPQALTLHQLYTDIDGAADGSFYLSGETAKTPYLFSGLPKTSFIIRLDTNLAVDWMQTDPTEMATGTGNLAMAITVDNSKAYLCLNGASDIDNTYRAFRVLRINQNGAG